MSISLKLSGSKNAIVKTISKALSKDLNIKLKKNYRKAEAKVRALIPNWIREQPETSSILDEGVFNSLNAQFGFVAGTAEQAVNSICLAVAQSVMIQFDQVDDKLEGGIIFYLQPNSFGNILNLQEANINALSGSLPWLYWLLTQGATTIITGYKYEADNSGRSGGGTMVAGRSWRVPPQYAGTIEDNFITRALQGREKELSSIMEDVLYA